MFISRVIKQLLIRMPVYAVAKGRTVGLYDTWAECQTQITGFSGAVFKKFNTKTEAQNFINAKSGLPITSIVASGESSTSTTSNKNLKRSISSTSTAAKGSSFKKFKIAPATSNIVKLSKFNDMMFQTDDKDYVHVYTDGSCEGNGQANACAGLGVYFGEGHKLNVAEPVSGRATNNCGEIQAATKAIQLAESNSIPKLAINTDSQFLINSATKWLPGWKSRGWKTAAREDVKNKADFVQLDNVMKRSGVDVKWNYVEAHKGILGNERADSLAREGSEMYRRNLKSTRKQ